MSKDGHKKIKALRNTRCQGEQLVQGKQYEVPNRDATYLVNIGKAEYVGKKKAADDEKKD